MCGIVFTIRSSASYAATGASPAESCSTASPSGSAASPTAFTTPSLLYRTPPHQDVTQVPSGMSLSPTAAATAAPSPPPPDSTGMGMALPDGSTPAFLDANETWNRLVEAVKPRGPDFSQSLVRKELVNKRFHFELRFHASVLHMRGDDLAMQPFTAPNGDVFLFNGEIFDGLEVSEHGNDGLAFFDRIQREGPTNFFATLRLEGPYAFIYYQAANQRVYFARDPLGRRSLLMHKPTPISPFLVLTSNAPGAGFPLDDWEEVDCDSVHCYHLRDLKGKSWAADGKRGLSSYPRYPKSMGLSQDILIYPFDRTRPTIPPPTPPLKDSLGLPVVTAELHIAITTLYRELTASIRKRVTPAPHLPADSTAKIAVLFSGGIDCATVALLADGLVPAHEPIDLINVAFENPRSIKAKTNSGGIGGGKREHKKKNKGSLYPGPKGKGTALNGEADSSPQTEEDSEMTFSSSGPTPEQNGPTTPFSSFYDDPMPDTPFEDLSSTTYSLIDEPPDLSIYEVPDRLTGRATLAELRRLRPGRRWNFVEVNVPYQEMLEHRQTVLDLMQPCRTVMDLSISIAFYFAARGRGVITNTAGGPPTPYESHARILLSGLGADELLGGYSRHRKAFNRTPEGDWTSLISELQMDLDRLPIRNLGRDDRIVSAHGKEARYPFLAANVVDFCARTLISTKCDMRFGEGVGDKMLLRLMAKSLGLTGAASLKKRAIHFGARTAKMDLGSGGLRGDDILVD